jgi:NADPH2:quinone reductase
MRAVVCRELGEPETVVVEERESPPLDPGRVRVRVEAAGVNYVDGLFVQGRYQMVPDTPFVPGSELAGTVVAAGADAQGWEPGTAVMASVGLGGFVDEIDLRPEQLLAVPDGVTAAQAATLGQSYATAWFSLSRRTTARPGEWIVVLGAGGGVGLAMLDVARALEMNTLAVASSPEKLELCIRRGAHEVIDYSSEDLKSRVREITGGGADIAVDPVGGPHAEAALRALGEFGRLLVIGFASGEIPTLPANQILLRNRSVLGVDWGLWALAHPEENTRLMGEVLDAVADGALHPVAPGEVPLEAAGQAMRDLLDRRVAGKLCLNPGL